MDAAFNKIQILSDIVTRLTKARKILEDEKNWCKTHLAKDFKGKPTTTGCGTSFCSMGALDKAHGVIYNYNKFTLTEKYLDKAMDGDIVGNNDKRSTKHIHVMMSYDFAILMAKDDLKVARKAAK